MLLILHPDIDESSDDYRKTCEFLRALPRVEMRTHVVQGQQQRLTEIYLLGDTHALDKDEIEALPAVERVVRISEEYRMLGRHKDEKRLAGFEYNGVTLLAGQPERDGRPVRGRQPASNVETMLRALQQHGQVCTRMGAYKPRTNPYAFQGHGAKCLPWVFELAGKHGIRVIAMEVTHESHIDEIDTALREDRPPHRRDAADRHAQHAELRAAEGDRAPADLPGAAQARLRHHA